MSASIVATVTMRAWAIMRPCECVPGCGEREWDAGFVGGEHMGDGLWIYIVEGLIALGLAGFMVWWTIPRKKKDDHE